MLARNNFAASFRVIPGWGSTNQPSHDQKIGAVNERLTNKGTGNFRLGINEPAVAE